MCCSLRAAAAISANEQGPGGHVSERYGTAKMWFQLKAHWKPTLSAAADATDARSDSLRFFFDRPTFGRHEHRD